MANARRDRDYLHRWGDLLSCRDGGGRRRPVDGTYCPIPRAAAPIVHRRRPRGRQFNGEIVPKSDPRVGRTISAHSLPTPKGETTWASSSVLSACPADNAGHHLHQEGPLGDVHSRLLFPALLIIGAVMPRDRVSRHGPEPAHPRRRTRRALRADGGDGGGRQPPMAADS